MNPDEPKPEVKAAEPQSQVKTEPKPEVKAEPKTEVKPEPKPEHTPETKTESKPETKSAAPKTAVRNKIIFTLSIIGILAGLFAAYLFGVERKAQPPVFKPVSSPYDSAIYANGIIESDQSSGANINIYPKFPAQSLRCWCAKAKPSRSAHCCFTIDDSVPGANVELAEANLKAARDQYDKRRAAYDIDPKSISKDVLDTAKDAVNQAAAT